MKVKKKSGNSGFDVINPHPLLCTLAHRQWLFDCLLHHLFVMGKSRLRRDPEKSSERIIDSLFFTLNLPDFIEGFHEEKSLITLMP
jgi:hypothetical protein